MRRLLATVAATIAMLAVASAAFAFTHWPNATCPDTVTIKQIWATGACKPTGGAAAVGDTVYGVAGIITAFDIRPSTFGFYMQNNATVREQIGMDVYCGSRDYNSAPYNWSLGDSVQVHFGAVEDYNLSKEVVGPNGVTTTNIIVNNVGSGPAIVPLPLTTTQLNWNAANTASDKWLCSLVRVNGPLYVRRSNTNNVYLVSPSSPSDTLQVFGAKFITTGTVVGSGTPNGTLVNFVQGIYENGGGTFSYELMPRGANDISIAAPPSVADAFPISGTDSIMVVFDRAVEKTSAENTANYSLASFGSIDGAHRLDSPDDDRVVLKISNGLPAGASEAITVNGVVALSGGLPMTSGQTRNFVNGVLSIQSIQAPDPDSLAANPCGDRSRFAGTGMAPGNRMSVEGTVTAAFGSRYTIQTGTDTRSGLSIFAPIVPLTPGHRYLFAGAVQEYFGETEASSNVYVRDYGSAPAPAPSVQPVGVLRDTVCDATQFVPTGEDYEGMLVTVEKALITQSQPGGTSFMVASTGGGPTAMILIAALSGNFTFAADSGHIVTVTGVLRWSFGTFRICPRSDSDIVDFGPGLIPGVPLNTSLSGTDSRDPDVILNGTGGLFMAWGRNAQQAAYSLSLDNGANWSLPKAVPRQGSLPALALADSNKICVLTAGLDSLRFHQSVDGGLQMLPVETTVDDYRTQYPALAVGGGGRIHAAWERYHAGIYHAGSTSGGASFSTPTAIALDDWPLERHSMPRMVASREDSVYVFWEYQRTSGPPNNRILFSRSLDGGASFSPPRAISDTTVVAALGDVQIDATGTLYVMRMQASPSDTVDFLRSANGGSTFTRVGHLPALAPSGICPKSFVLGPSGAVYAIVGICTTDLYYTHSADGGVNWGPLVNFTHGFGTVGEPRGTKVILDPTGKPMVAWFGTRAGSTEVYIGRMIN